MPLSSLLELSLPERPSSTPCPSSKVVKVVLNSPTVLCLSNLERRRTTDPRPRDKGPVVSKARVRARGRLTVVLAVEAVGVPGDEEDRVTRVIGNLKSKGGQAETVCGVLSVRAAGVPDCRATISFLFVFTLFLPSRPLYSISFIIINIIIIKIYLHHSHLSPTTKNDKMSNSRHDVLYEEVCLHFMS